jgi:hypothetical protein
VPSADPVSALSTPGPSGTRNLSDRRLSGVLGRIRTCHLLARKAIFVVPWRPGRPPLVAFCWYMAVFSEGRSTGSDGVRRDGTQLSARVLAPSDHSYLIRMGELRGPTGGGSAHVTGVWPCGRALPDPPAQTASRTKTTASRSEEFPSESETLAWPSLCW